VPRRRIDDAGARSRPDVDRVYERRAARTRLELTMGGRHRTLGHVEGLLIVVATTA